MSGYMSKRLTASRSKCQASCRRQGIQERQAAANTSVSLGNVKLDGYHVRYQ